MSGQAALRVLDEGTRPDIIVLDILMPVMDGLEFLDALRARPEFAAIPIVILSEIAANHPRVRVLSGVRALAKPYHFEDLLACI